MIKEPWLMLPHDLWSHLHDWRNACLLAYQAAEAKSDDEAYWVKQLLTLDKIEKAVAERKERLAAAKYDEMWIAANRSAGVYD